MKKIGLYVLAGLLTTQVALAQNGAVNKAILYKDELKLDKAQEEIENAVKHEKTSGKPKTWFTRGEIYSSMLLLPQFKTLSKEPAAIAVESYKKAMELDKPNGSYYKDSEKALQSLYSNVVNETVTAFQANDFETALKYNKIAQELNPKDTLPVVHALSIGSTKGDYELMRQSYLKLLELNNKSPETYKNLAIITRQLDKDDNKALEYITAGRKLYPDNKDLMTEELNLLIATNKSGEAKTKLQEAIKADPKNPIYHVNLGALYFQEAYELDKTKDKKAATSREMAKESFLKAHELDKNSYESNFYLGAIYYSQAADLIQKTNKMDLAQYNKEGKKMEADAKKIMDQALPYLEKAYSLNNKDADTVNMLRSVYSIKKREADAAKMSKEYEALTKNK